MPMLTCGECGVEYTDASESCPACGAPAIDASPAPPVADPAAPARKGSRFRPFVVVSLLLFAFWYWFGFYSLQPIGALPEGRTVIVRRTGDEPFFNSPDGTCLRRTGGVSLLCRGMAMGDGPIDRIVIRLPYMHWAYLASTGGEEFDR